jgi:amidase
MVMEMTLDHIGPMADRVENVARLLSVMAGPDPLDPRQRGMLPADHVRDYLPALRQDVNGLRIALVREGFSLEPNEALGLPGGEAVVDRKVRAALKALEKRGATVSEVSIPMHRDGTCIWLAIHLEGPAEIIKSNGLGSGWRGYYNTTLAEAFAKGFRTRARDLSHTVKLVLLLGEYMQRNYHGLYYAMGQNLRARLRQAYDDVLGSYDLLAMPTVPFRATPLPPPDCSIEDYVAFGLNMIHNTGQFDVTGHPAISVPCGMEDGLPIGLMLVGRHFDDFTVIRAADCLEQIADWRSM